MTVRFLWKSTCSTCRQAKSFLTEHGINTEARDLKKQPLTLVEAQAVLRLRPLQDLLNFRHDAAKKGKWKKRLPSLDDAASAVADDVNVLRRPILVADGNVLVGFDADAYKQALALYRR